MSPQITELSKIGNSETRLYQGLGKLSYPSQTQFTSLVMSRSSVRFRPSVP